VAKRGRPPPAVGALGGVLWRDDIYGEGEYAEGVRQVGDRFPEGKVRHDLEPK